jgi:hypothetical protein
LKDDLVMASLAALVDQEIVVPDTDSTRADIDALMHEAVELYRGALPRRLMPNLVSAMAERPELARAVREGFLVRRREAGSSGWVSGRRPRHRFPSASHGVKR